MAISICQCACPYNVTIQYKLSCVFFSQKFLPDLPKRNAASHTVSDEWLGLCRHILTRTKHIFLISHSVPVFDCIDKSHT